MGNYCCGRSILLSKLKWVFAIFKLAKFSTVFSMFLSLGAYAVLYGWKFGVALIYLLFVHEMGHLWAAKRKGSRHRQQSLFHLWGPYWNERDAENAKDEATLPIWGRFSDFCHFTGDTALYNDERAILGSCYFAWKYD